MTTLTEYLEIAADNCVSSGDVDIAVLMRQAASTISRQQSELAESREREGRMREAIEGALAIRELWMLTGNCTEPQHHEEAKTLYLMEQAFIDALAAEKEQK